MNYKCDKCKEVFDGDDMYDHARSHEDDMLVEYSSNHFHKTNELTIEQEIDNND